MHAAVIAYARTSSVFFSREYVEWLISSWIKNLVAHGNHHALPYRPSGLGVANPVPSLGLITHNGIEVWKSLLCREKKSALAYAWHVWARRPHEVYISGHDQQATQVMAMLKYIFNSSASIKSTDVRLVFDLSGMSYLGGLRYVGPVLMPGGDHIFFLNSACPLENHWASAS